MVSVVGLRLHRTHYITHSFAPLSLRLGLLRTGTGLTAGILKTRHAQPPPPPLTVVESTEWIISRCRPPEGIFSRPNSTKPHIVVGGVGESVGLVVSACERHESKVFPRLLLLPPPPLLTYYYSRKAHSPRVTWSGGYLGDNGI